MNNSVFVARISGRLGISPQELFRAFAWATESETGKKGFCDICGKRITYEEVREEHLRLFEQIFRYWGERKKGEPAVRLYNKLYTREEYASYRGQLYINRTRCSECGSTVKRMGNKRRESDAFFNALKFASIGK